MVNLLKTSVVTLNFTKISGESRVMNATLLTEYLPQKDQKQLLTENNANVNTVKVWDTDIDAWRAIRMDSIKKIVVSN